eukprot:CAMPEP_0168204488 /NCGR_PEP_ID=MMETSP0139_2-20121125/25420_1 /TAXON_ID=44445 /ORGANISM="Pseudo-nitzschia australis, Strain 10249 10 AB" /LENGTH=1051 /DNA_ID=CAMNT_0008130421 /DNA_START=198 /DNA_END=3350 /DNA_ORIENTATION=+
MATKNPSNVSTMGALIVLVALALLTARSDAFVSPPSIVNANRVLVPSQQQHNNDRSSRLYSSTASGSGFGVIDSWKLLPDGRIQGVMADTGDNVLTSPLKKKNGLKESMTIRTVSGSRYELGMPASTASNQNVNSNERMSPARLGTPRATLPGRNIPGFNVNSGSNVRATQPLNSAPTASQDRVLREYMANKGRGTATTATNNEVDPDTGTALGKKNKYLKPLVGTASALAVGALLASTGTVSDKGVDLSKLKNLPDPTKVFESTKSLGFPDIKALKAPAIPSPGISLPKFEGVSAPKLPEVKLPEGIKINVPDGVKNIGDSASGAIDDALDGVGLKLPPSPFAKKSQVVSVGAGPYRVPMPYLDEQVVQAKKEAAEKEEADRIQKIKAEEAARKKAEDLVIAQQNKERELALKQRAEEEARIRQEADVRVKKAEQETALLRAEAEKETALLRAEAEKETARLRSEAEKEAARLRDEVQRTKAEVEKTRAEVEKTQLDTLKKEKAAAEETARLKKDAEAALMKERAAKEEFSQKLQAAEMAQLSQAKDFTAKLQAAQEAAEKERTLAVATAAAEKLAEEAAVREAEAAAAATAAIRKTSVGASAARKATYPKPSMTTYEAWQQRQQVAYQTRINEVASGVKKVEPVAPSLTSSSSNENLSTFKRWQQSVAAQQAVSMSAQPVTAAFVTGAPAPVINKLVSGSTKLSEVAKTLNGDLGYTIAGSSALIGGITYGYMYQKIQGELAEYEDTQPPPTKETIVPPPPTSSATVQPLPSIVPPTKKIVVPPPPGSSATVKPLPPIVPPTRTVQAKQESATSATMAIDAKPYLDVLDDGSASVTKSVSPRPPKQSYSPFAGPPTEVTKPPPANPSTPEATNNGGSYLESMSNVSGGKPSLKTSYSPFSNSKETTGNDSLYNTPSSESSPIEEKYEEPLKSDTSDTSVIGASYLESMAGGDESAKATLKTSYSPFGTPKTFKTSSDSFNDDPLAINEESSTSEPLTTGALDSTTSSQGSYLNGLNDSNAPSGVKKSYSPFGRKPKEVNDNGLYSPGNS